MLQGIGVELGAWFKIKKRSALLPFHQLALKTNRGKPDYPRNYWNVLDSL